MLKTVIKYILEVAKQPGRNLQMPGDGRYQPNALKPFLGYDQWAAWLLVVEWAWLKTLVKIGKIPGEAGHLISMRRLKKLMELITTTAQDAREKNTRHDIRALIELMCERLPKLLRRWVHFCATSYDIIESAYALILQQVFIHVLWPKMLEIDIVWRKKIEEYADTLQGGRTHLQPAVPITAGFWLSSGHSRYANSAKSAKSLSKKIPGKFTGACGTLASQRMLLPGKNAEDIVLNQLALPAAEVSTQIAPPEDRARFYFELALLSGIMANLGDDVRLLQAPEFGEVWTLSSGSSAMSNKINNPIIAENIAGMHVSVLAEFQKIEHTLISNLQRDLRWSNVMRSFTAVIVYVYQQMENTLKLLNSLRVDEQRCAENFKREGHLVVGELLHLALMEQGMDDAYDFVKKEIMPIARKENLNLRQVMDSVLDSAATQFTDYRVAWNRVHWYIKDYLNAPERFIGDAVVIAKRESQNIL
jgi:adenylosuccinate lyase